MPADCGVWSDARKQATPQARKPAPAGEVRQTPSRGLALEVTRQCHRR
jgi:hypothetical protein